MGCHFLLQGIFPTQGSNLGLRHCRHTLPSEPPGKTLTFLILYSLQMKLYAKEEKRGLRFSFFLSIFFLYYCSICIHHSGFPCTSDGKESASNERDLGSILRLGKTPAEGNTYQLQYSCLGNPMDRGSLIGYSPWSQKESDMAEHLSTYIHFYFLSLQMVYNFLEVSKKTLYLLVCFHASIYLIHIY